jgi:hypothetical protein
VQVAQGLTTKGLTVLRVVAEVWRFLYRLQSRLQTTEPLAVAVAVVEVVRVYFTLITSWVSLIFTVVAVVAEAEQEPLTLQVELEAVAVPSAAWAFPLVALAELAQAEVVEVVELVAAGLPELPELVEPVALGVQQEPPAGRQATTRGSHRALEARPAQRLAEIQTLLIMPLAHV